MKRAVRASVFFVAVCVLIAALCAIGSAIVALASSRATYTHAIAWALWIGGALTVLLVGQSGSTSRMAGESRIVVGAASYREATCPSRQARSSSFQRASS
jgi:putative copper export protein